MENKKYNDTANWVIDTEFIKGNVHENYPVPYLSKEQLSDGLFHQLPTDFSGHYIEITREDTGKSRRYPPVDYAEFYIQNFLEQVDNTENYNEKMLTLNNAKYRIDNLVDYVTENDKHNLSLGNCTDKYDSHNFSKIYKTLNDRIEYLKVHKEFETIPQEQKTVSVSTGQIKQQPIENDIINEVLSVLSGNWTGGSMIMKVAEYKRLIDYFKCTLDNKTLPENIIPISRTIATTEFIRYTFYIFWKKNKNRISRTLTIDFLHAVFEQFSDTQKTTTDKKFSKKINSYDTFIVNLLK